MSIQTVAIIFMVIVVINAISLAMIFKKAEKPLWAAFVPVFDALTLYEITGTVAYASLIVYVLFNPILFILITGILLANSAIFWLTFILVLYVILSVFVLLGIWTELASDFGQDPLYGLGTAFLPFVFLPILAFGPARYQNWKRNKVIQ